MSLAIQSHYRSKLMNHPMAAATLLVLVATVGFAFKGVLAGLAFAEGLTLTGLMLLRTAFAVPLYWLVVYILSANANANVNADASPKANTDASTDASAGAHATARADWAAIGKAAATGALFLLAALSDFAAIERIGTGPSRVLLFSFPGFVMAIEAVRQRRWPKPRYLAAFAIAWVGLSFVAMPQGPQALAGRELSGVAWALFGAASYAAFLIAAQSSIRTMGSIRFAAIANTGTAVALVAALPLILAADAGGGDIWQGNWRAVGWIALMAALTTVLPFVLLFEGMRHVGASRASMITLLGPPITVVAAWLILDETFTIVQIAGTVIVISAVSLLKQRNSRP